MNSFTVKDSGEREEYASGMRRDVTAGKTNYALVLDGPLIERLAAHLTLGAEKYGNSNWMKARSMEEHQRFLESAARHFTQWWYGEDDEDHFAATVFNMNAATYVEERLEEDSS